MHDLKVASASDLLDGGKHIISVGNRDDLPAVLRIDGGIQPRSSISVQYQDITGIENEPLEPTDNRAA